MNQFPDSITKRHKEQGNNSSENPACKISFISFINYPLLSVEQWQFAINNYIDTSTGAKIIQVRYSNKRI